MSAPRKNTGRSLIINGDFSEFYNSSGWQDHAGNANQESEGSLDYLYVRSGIIKQSFSLPIEPGMGKGRYQLVFDYQPPQNQPPAPEEPVHPYFERRAFPSESVEKNDLVGASFAKKPPGRADPDSMEWLPRSIDYGLFSSGDTRFEVRFASGRNPETGSTEEAGTGDRASGRVDWPSHIGALHLAKVAVHVHLPDLKLEACRVTLDGDEARPLADGRYPICRGADHQLVLVPTPACAWGGSGPYPGTHVYADWENAGDADRLGLTLTPLHPEDDGAQHVTRPWKIVCADRDSGAATLLIESIYDAAPHHLPVSVGHYKLKIGEVRNAEIFPVVEDEESETVAVKVFSAITNNPVPDIQVSWHLPDGATATSQTNAEGWAEYAFYPAAAGTHAILAVVESSYGEREESRSLEVTALARDPWVSEIKAQFDDFPLAYWDSEKTAYPCRGETHTLKLVPNAGSPLIGSKVALVWGEGDPASQLDVTVSPALDMEQTLSAAGVVWTLTCGNVRNGNFRLRVINARVTRQLDIPMSLGHTRLKIGGVREATGIPVVEDGESETLGVQVLSAITDSPLPGIQVTWRLPDGTTTSSTTGDDGWAEYEFRPTSAGKHTITVDVESRYDDSKDTRTLDVEAVATNPWKEHIQVQFDAFSPTYWGSSKTVYLCRGRTHTLKLVPNAGSPLIGSKVTLTWGEGDPLAALNVSVSPALGSEQTLSAAGVTWTLTCGNVKDGAFTLFVGSSQPIKRLEMAMSLAHNNFRFTYAEDQGVGGPVWLRTWIVKVCSVYGAEEPVAGVPCEFPGNKLWPTGADGVAIQGVNLLTAPRPHVVRIRVPYTGEELTITP